MYAAAWKQSYLPTEDQTALAYVLLHALGLGEVSSIFLVKLGLVLPLERPNTSLTLVCCCFSIGFVP